MSESSREQREYAEWWDSTLTGKITNIASWIVVAPIALVFYGCYAAIGLGISSCAYNTYMDYRDEVKQQESIDNITSQQKKDLENRIEYNVNRELENGIR